MAIRAWPGTAPHTLRPRTRTLQSRRLSRSVSNLGSSLGAALVGSVLVAVKLPEGRPFAVALTIMLVVALIGLVLAILIPRQPIEAIATPSPGTVPATSQPAP